MTTLNHSVGNDYAYLPGGLPFSGGVVALPGFEIVRARFARPMPVDEGFEAIAAHLRSRQRPLTALCAAELRSPQPSALDAFAEFNRRYATTLQKWGVLQGEQNPVARSNVCPVHDGPAEAVFHAFSYTLPSDAAQFSMLTTSDHSERAPGPRSFVLAGCTEWVERGKFPEGIVALDDTSPGGLLAKANAVLDTLQSRCATLGCDWSALTAVQVYTEHDIGALVGPVFSAHGLTRLGLHWFVCRPPIARLEFEVDARNVRREIVID